MYYGGGAATKINNQSQPLTHDFVSLTLKGRSDGFTLKGGDATSGEQATMYDGPRPDREIAGSCGGGSNAGEKIQLQKCVAGSTNQTWAFEKNGKSIVRSPQPRLLILLKSWYWRFRDNINFYIMTFLGLLCNPYWFLSVFFAENQRFRVFTVVRDRAGERGQVFGHRQLQN